MLLFNACLVYGAIQAQQEKMAAPSSGRSQTLKEVQSSTLQLTVMRQEEDMHWAQCHGGQPSQEMLWAIRQNTGQPMGSLAVRVRESCLQSGQKVAAWTRVKRVDPS